MLLRARLMVALAAAIIVWQTASAQESIRPSLASAQSAEANKPVIDVGQYNLLLGPVLAGFSANVDVAYNDNIDLSETDRKGSLIIEPGVTANLLWQATEDNALRLNMGAGYVKYLTYPQFNSSSLIITPDSQIAFDIYAGDFKFTIFDQLSIQQNPLEIIDLHQVARLLRLENAAGINVTWDLDKVVVFGGYAHYIFYSFESAYDFLNENENQVYVSLSIRLSDAVTVGLRGTLSNVEYQQKFQNNSINYSAGAFATVQLTPYIRAEGEVGYQGADYNTGGDNGDSSQLNAPYFHLQLDHRLNRYWTEHLSTGYETQLGLTTNYTEVFYVRYAGGWRVNSRTNAGVAAYYEHSMDSPGPDQSEHINRVGVGLRWTYSLGPKANLHFSYDFVNNASDLTGHSFYQNQVLLGIGYVF
jgi:hypothetical protein